eukprot:TRINITY_DN5699_c0_g2_i1.p1 TRINITY_DN5699_c0_g2~~TRINITY_DN5699_c0_g2_i1.p1  ORF type:complete len:558 (-),score=123.02 TRINITY_DN5699_c0_g2_i1:3-1676(-)
MAADDDWADGGGDFAPLTTGTVAEQRLSMRGGYAQQQQPASSSGRFGGLAASAAGGFSAAAGGLSAAAGSLGSMAGGFGSRLSLSRGSGTGGSPTAADCADVDTFGQVASDRTRLSSSSSYAATPAAPSAPASAGSGGLSGAAAGVTNATAGVAGATAGVASVTVGALSWGASALTGGLATAASSAASATSKAAEAASAAAGRAPGSAAGEVAATIAVSLASAFLELVAGVVPLCDVPDKQRDLGNLMDAVAACRTLSELAAKMLDLWFMVRLESLANWPLPSQRDWLRLAHAVQNADLTKATSPLVRTTCGLLLEFCSGCRIPTKWDSTRVEAWAQGVRAVAQLAAENSPPPSWTFPQLAIRRVAHDPADADGDVDFGSSPAPRFRLQRRDEKQGHLGRATGAEVVGGIASDGKVICVRPQMLADAVTTEPPRALYAQLDALAPTATAQEKCISDGDKMLMQKTRPVKIHNQASVAFKVCLYSETDPVCALPVGGLGGPCVVNLGKDLRVQMRPPGRAERFKMIVYTPGFIDRMAYSAVVARGSTVQLRSHDCTVE